MPTNPNQNLDEYKIYRSNFLPGFSRPIVFTTSSQHNLAGLPLLRVEYLIVYPNGPVQAEAVSLDKRYLPRSENNDSIVKTLLEVALDRAENELEKLGNQTVLLEEVAADKFLALSHREDFKEKWQEIRDRTHCSPLKDLLYDLEQSQLHNLIRFEIINPPRR